MLPSLKPLLHKLYAKCFLKDFFRQRAFAAVGLSTESFFSGDSCPRTVVAVFGSMSDAGNGRLAVRAPLVSHELRSSAHRAASSRARSPKVRLWRSLFLKICGNVGLRNANMRPGKVQQTPIQDDFPPTVIPARRQNPLCQELLRFSNSVSGIDQRL